MKWTPAQLNRLKHAAPDENRLQIAMDAQGLTQQKLGDLAGIHQANISRYVNGTLPELATAHKIAGALNLTIEQLWPREAVAS